MPPKPGQGDAARRKAGVAAMKETQVRLSDKITFSCVLFVCLQRYAPKTKETHQKKNCSSLSQQKGAHTT